MFHHQPSQLYIFAVVPVYELVNTVKTANNFVISYMRDMRNSEYFAISYMRDMRNSEYYFAIS